MTARRARGRAAARLAWAALALTAGCVAGSVRPQTPCPAARSAEAAICARDAELRPLRARFRASVGPARDPGEGGTAPMRRSAEGVLLLEPPGAMRVKLFGVAGITVLDALWVGGSGGAPPRGLVRSPLRGTTREIEVRPGEPIGDPDVAMSFALWALWQPRCAAPPRAVAGEPGAYALDPASSWALRRSVVVADGAVREETLVLPGRGAAGGDGATEEAIVARFGALDCALAMPLAHEVALDAPEQGWSATVHVVEATEDDALDPALFALPRPTAAARGDAASEGAR